MRKQHFPLTDFVINAQKATVDQLRRANPAKMAAKYSIREIHARQVIEWELMMKGGKGNGQTG